MAETKMLNDLIKQAGNRRGFVRKLGFAGAAVGVAAATKGFAQTTFQDSDYLNFILNVKYLEAAFYTMASTGQTLASFPITISGAGSGGITSGGSQVAFGTSTAISSAALQLAADERAHVALLQSTIAGLGAVSIALPGINLAALGFGFGSVGDFLRLARILEDVGVTAHAGVAPLIQSAAVRVTLARIFAVEAVHSGTIRSLITQAGISTFPALDGADHLPPPSGVANFSADSNGLVEVRTPQQVLALAYGATNVATGSFFPNGVNGAITVSASATATTDGAYITASPNPIVVASGNNGTTTISWNVPGGAGIQIRVASPNGPVFSYFGPSGSMQTGSWVQDGTVFYLETANTGDQSAGTPIASVVVHVVP